MTLKLTVDEQQRRGRGQSVLIIHRPYILVCVCCLGILTPEGLIRPEGGT